MAANRKRLSAVNIPTFPERVKALALGLSNPDAVPQLCLGDIAAYVRAALPSQEYE